jgi:single-strand DNA-binding protein
MVNKVILVGNVGADPEIRYLEGGNEGGVPVANLNMATTESYTNKSGERVSQTEWHRIVLWRGLAKIAESYVKKGMKIYIEGRLKTRTWDDKDGTKRYTTEIWADNMQMLDKKSDKPVDMTEVEEAPKDTDIKKPDDLPF